MDINDIMLDHFGNPMIFENKQMTYADFKAGIGRTDKAWVDFMDFALNEERIKDGELPIDFEAQRIEAAQNLFKTHHVVGNSGSIFDVLKQVPVIQGQNNNPQTHSTTQHQCPGATPKTYNKATQCPVTNTNQPVTQGGGVPSTNRKLVTTNIANIANNSSMKGGMGMSDIVICDVDMTILRSELETECANYDNANGWNYEFKDMRTRQGKDVVVLKDKDGGGELSMFFDKVSGMVTVKPHKFGSKNYIVGNTEVFAEILGTFCKKGTKNRMGYIKNGVGYLCEHGSEQQGTIRVVKGGALTDIDDDDGTGTVDVFKVRVPIKQYLDENPSVKTQIYNSIAPAKDMTSFVNAFGKYLISQKGTGNMDFNVFRDLLNQCTILGANDPTVLKIKSLVL